MPNSSELTLICRRSVARIVPSWIGTSYCLPVRLSVIVSVSGIGRHVRRAFVSLRFTRDRVAARQPPSQVGTRRGGRRGLRQERGDLAAELVLDDVDLPARVEHAEVELVGHRPVFLQ